MRGRIGPYRRMQEAGGFADYQALASQDPAFASAGAEIASQLSAEGWPQAKIDLAQGSFADVVDKLGSMGVQIDDPIGDAKQYVLTGQTIAGAVSTVQGLAAAAQSGSPVAITQAFTGVMIGTMVTAGAVSAGTGALIVAGAAALSEVIQGLLAGNPGVKICAGVEASSQPDLVVGCLAGFTNGGTTASTVLPPGHPNWRTFTAKTKVEDSPWYLPCGGGGCGDFNWHGVTWGNKYTANPPGPMRPIDWAFGAFANIEQYLTSPVGPPGFTDGWCAAWKSNAEYALNGLKPQDDSMVLAHYVRTWNASHAPSPVVPLSTIAAPYSYLSGLTQSAIGRVQVSSDFYPGSQDLAINAGPLYAPPRPVVHLTLAQHPQIVRLTLGHAATAAAAAPKPTVGAGSVLAVGALALGAAMLWKPALLRKLGVRL